MRCLSFVTLFAAVSAAPAFATVVPPCRSASQAISAQQEEAWIRQCAAAQRQGGAISEAESSCRRWLERCRRAPAARPGIMTY
jgi:hypothetical protein